MHESQLKMRKMNVHSKTVKHLKEHIEGKFHDVSVDSDFMDMTPKAQTSKPKNLTNGTTSN